MAPASAVARGAGGGARRRGTFGRRCFVDQHLGCLRCRRHLRASLPPRTMGRRRERSGRFRASPWCFRIKWVPRTTCSAKVRTASALQRMTPKEPPKRSTSSRILRCVTPTGAPPGQSSSHGVTGPALKRLSPRSCAQQDRAGDDGEAKTKRTRRPHPPGRDVSAREYPHPLVSNRRPRLLVLNQYYWPGVEATAHLLTELCEALAADYDVTVITGRLHDHEHDPDYESRGGVEIVRVHSAAYDRAQLHHRAINYLTYLARALRRGLFDVERPDVVLCMTDPPMVGDVALAVARRYRVPLVVVSQDVFPEIAVELEAPDESRPRRDPARADELLPPPRRPGGGDRGDDAAAARGEGRAAAAAARDPELGRHEPRSGRSRARTRGRPSTASTAASSSCTRATSGTLRTSTR